MKVSRVPQAAPHLVKERAAIGAVKKITLAVTPNTASTGQVMTASSRWAPRGSGKHQGWESISHFPSPQERESEDKREGS